MKSYLQLIKEYEKVHRKKNRITIVCIVIAVSLVTAIFGMADMEIKAQEIRQIQQNGNWHVALQHLEESKIHDIVNAFENKIETSGWMFGFPDLDNWTYQGVSYKLTAGEEEILQEFGFRLEEGAFPADNSEIIVDKKSADTNGIRVGDSISFQIPEQGERSFTVSGLCNNTALMLKDDMHVVVFGKSLTAELYEEDTYRAAFYIRFKDRVNLGQTRDRMISEFSLQEGELSENTVLFALSAQSDESYMKQLYMVAIVLGILVLIAGILMISGTFNTNVAERTQFFGMLRCLGATKSQIKKYVLLESLNYLKLAIPIGVILGTVTYWGACAYLKVVNYEFFSTMPMMSFSAISLAGGVLVGVCTVLFAALAPCKRASKVSPLAAITASRDYRGITTKRRSGKLVAKIEHNLGYHHATSNKKNLFLMTASFAVSIVLFLSFSVAVNFMNHAITPLEAWAPDLEIMDPSGSNELAPSIVDELKCVNGIKAVYGRQYAVGQTEWNNTVINVTLLTYEENQFQWAKKYLVEGDMDAVSEGSNTVMIAYDMNMEYHAGDHLMWTYGDEVQDFTVNAVAKKTPFKAGENELIIITNESEFKRIVGEDKYAVIDVQLKGNATDAVVNEIRSHFDSDIFFSDSRLSNEQAKAAVYSFSLFIYAFLAIIALITVFNIINSMNMSIAARLKQYGVMRAVGMSIKQVKRMILSEAVTYAAFGSVAGSLIGLLLHKKLFEMMVTFRWGTAWTIPWGPVCVIILLVLGSTLISVVEPMKKFKAMEIISAIAE